MPKTGRNDKALERISSTPRECGSSALWGREAAGSPDYPVWDLLLKSFIGVVQCPSAFVIYVHTECAACHLPEKAPRPDPFPPSRA
jgi:hypothetical protein